MPTLADWLAEAPFGLGMSSGFFSFFAHTGMLSALTARGLAPAHVGGSSAGALVAGAFAAGVTPEALAEVLLAMDRRDFWDPAPGLGLLAGRKFDALLRRVLPVTTFAACPRPAIISVFDIATRTTRVVRAGDLPTAIRASCAVPGMFQPVRVDGPVELVSFERDLDALALALAHPRAFPHLRHPAPHRLLARDRFERPGLIWTLVRGELLARLADAPAPDVIWWDPFSAKVDGGLWTHAAFAAVAARPTALTTAAHTITYGDGIYFTTTHDFAGTAETTNLRALPYPPQSVWCAPVSDGNSHRVVLVAEHADLYTAYWVVHDSVSPSLLKAVGCPEF